MIFCFTFVQKTEHDGHNRNKKELASPSMLSEFYSWDLVGLLKKSAKHFTFEQL